MKEVDVYGHVKIVLVNMCYGKRISKLKLKMLAILWTYAYECKKELKLRKEKFYHYPEIPHKIGIDSFTSQGWEILI